MSKSHIKTKTQKKTEIIFHENMDIIIICLWMIVLLIFGLTLYICMNSQKNKTIKNLYDDTYLNCVIYPKDTNYLLCKIKRE